MSKESMEGTVTYGDVSFSYPYSEVYALKGVNLTIHPGETVAIMGRTGAGKTTLVSMLNGIVPHSTGGKLEGTVQVLGLDIMKHEQVELARRVGMIFDDPDSQLFGLTVEEDVCFMLQQIGVAMEEAKKRVKWALDVVGLQGFENRYPRDLSGGQKQRVALASTLAPMRDILVLDEPTSELDPAGRFELLQTLKKLKQELRLTIVLVTHYSEEAVELADEVYLLSQGEIVHKGPPREFFADVENCEKYGVEPPQVTQIAFRLKDYPNTSKTYGFPVSLPEAAIVSRKIFDNIQSALSSMKFTSEHVTNEDIIELRHVSVSFPTRTGTPIKALQDVSLTIHKGELIGLIGQNGSGKSTLSKIICGLLVPDSGSVYILGKDTKLISPRELFRLVQYCHQNPDDQIFNTTVFKEVAYGVRRMKLPKEEIETRVKKALAAVELEEFEEKDPFMLSRAERRKVATASVLSMDPAFIVIDEPTTGMDWSGATKMMEFIRRINSAGKTIAIISHNIPLIAEYTNRIVVMDGGRIILDGHPRDVFSRRSELLPIGLRAPQVTELFQEIGMNETILTVEEGARVFASLE
mgnify:CR=1 FL=1